MIGAILPIAMQAIGGLAGGKEGKGSEGGGLGALLKPLMDMLSPKKDKEESGNPMEMLTKVAGGLMGGGGGGLSLLG